MAEPITVPLHTHGPATRPTASNRPSSICRLWWDGHASKPAAHHKNPSSSPLSPVHTQQQPSEQAMAALRLGLDAASQPCCVLARGALPEMRGVVGSVATAWAPHGGRRWRSWPPPHSLTAARRRRPPARQPRGHPQLSWTPDSGTAQMRDANATTGAG